MLANLLRQRQSREHFQGDPVVLAQKYPGKCLSS